VPIDASFKSSAINASLEDSNTIDETRTSSSKDELRNKKRAKKEDKDKRKRDETSIARAILKAKRRKALDEEIDRNEHDLMKR